MSWSAGRRTSSELEGVRVLIVDDEWLIAVELERGLKNAGADVVGPVGRVEAALKLAREATLSVAILDIRLGGDRIDPVARALIERGIPFLFYSGQVEDDAVRRDWPGRPFIARPASTKAVVTALAALVRPAENEPPR